MAGESLAGASCGATIGKRGAGESSWNEHPRSWAEANRAKCHEFQAALVDIAPKLHRRVNCERVDNAAPQ